MRRRESSLFGVGMVLVTAFVGMSMLEAQTASTIAIDVAAQRRAIDPRIYGLAFASPQDLLALGVPLNRSGGNATTSHNWQLNATNRGSDWYFESLDDGGATPGAAIDSFVSSTRAGGAAPMVTIPTIGRVAKLGPGRARLSSYSQSKYGAQTDADWTYFSDAGNGILASTGQPITTNDPNDAKVAIDSSFEQGLVQHLVGKWGAASAGGVRYYILDNEPSLWFSTHRDVHNVGPTMDEIFDYFLDYGAKVKAADPGALIVGPEEWGWSGYFYSGFDQQYGAQHGWSVLPDRNNHAGADYLPWLLDQLRAHQQATGQRLLDVFTVHYYPQGGEFGNDTSPAMQLRRNRSTRSLWDPNYVDETWIGDKVQLIPRLKSWVAAHYPNTPIGITEYNWGAEGHINGATAQADILGIFGREGLDLAARWTTPDAATPTYKAIQLYRNYDGHGSAFGDTSLSASGPNPDQTSVFAAQRTSDGALTIMVVSKRLTGNTPTAISLANFTPGATAQVFRLDSGNAIQHLADVAVSGNSFSTSLPPQSITLFVLPAGAAPTLAVSDVSVTEGNSGSINANFTVTLSSVSASAVSVAYATQDGTAGAPSDYASASGTLSFAPGETAKTVAVPVNGDATVEAGETFTLGLSAPVNVAISDGQGTGSIVNDDSTPVTISIGDVTLAEGNSGTTNAAFTVTLSATSGQPVTVDYATGNGTVSAGSDYAAKSGNLSFAAGSTSQTISVAVTGDTTVEPNETLVVNLSNAVGASIARAQGTATIANDDVGFTALPTYYVAPTGSDSNPCTFALPCRQIRRALTLVSPGATIFVADGSYLGFDVNDIHGAAGAPVTIKAQGTGAQVVPTTDRSDNRDTIFVTFSSYFVVDGLRSFGATRAAVRVDQSPNVTIRNGVFGNNATWGIFTDFSDDLLIEKNECYGSGTEHGIYVSNSGDRPVLRDNRSHDNAGGGIQLNADLSSGGDGIITGALLERNVIYNNGTAGGGGINLDGVQNSIVRNNVLYNNHASGITNFQLDGAQGPRGMQILHNTIDMASNGRWALLISSTSGTNVVRNNILFNRNAARGGILYGSAADVASTDSDYNVLDRVTPDDGGSVLTLAQWKAQGHEPHSFSATPSSLWVNDATADYRLRAGSPAIDTGPALANATSDMDLNVRPWGPSSDLGADEAVAANFVTTPHVTGLSSPTSMHLAPDGRIFISQQAGQLRVFKNGSLLGAPFVSLSVDSSGERGLLGAAFDPDFATNQFVYVYYTVPGSPAHNRVSRFTASGDVAAAGSEAIILDLDNLSGATNHNGGALHFGPDGLLYVAVGENANGSNAQSLATVLGKMLRINPDGSIPADNPFLSSTTGKNRAIWALGLRNPYTFDFQAGTGRMFINDVGQSTFEEIDDGIVASNYGWPATEGPTTNPSFRGPIYSYQHSAGTPTGCAITGGAFYNPPSVQFPGDYVGKYFFADFCGGWIYLFDPAAGTATPFKTGIANPVDLSVGSDGSLFYLARGEGRIYRVQNTPVAPPPLPTLSIDDVTLTEGNSGTKNAVFTVTLSASSTQPVSVAFATTNGTATAGQDYTAQSGPLTFTPGTTSQTIPVVISGDTTVEPNETFLVNLSAPSGATITDAQGGGTILNDDSAPPPPVGTPVVWTSLVGVSANSNSLTKTAETAWGNAGAVSSLALASGNGSVEVTASETTSYRMFGLSNGDSSANYTDIDFAFYPATGGSLLVYEAGTSRGSFGTYGTNDKLQVAVESGVVRYKKNGTVVYTSTLAPSYPLLVDTALYTQGATLNAASVLGVWSTTPPTPPPPPPPVGTPVVWTSLVGVSANANSLTKTAATAWGNAGAVSSLALASGNGSVEVTASETTSYRMFGLSNGDSSANYTDIDFGFYPAAGGGLWVYEAGTSRGSFGTYGTNDKLQVAVESGVVRYKKNGTVVYTSTLAPTYPLLVDTALYTQGATLNAASVLGVWSTTPPTPPPPPPPVGTPVVWTSLVGVSANANSLTKTAATAWGNAGAVSSLALASGNGSVEVTASETTSYRMFGLSNGDSSANYTDIDFGFYPAAGGGLWVYEAGTSRGSFGTYGTNDKLQVAVESGVVRYKKNGTVVYTSTVAPSYPLLVDTAFYTQGATLNAAAVSGSWSTPPPAGTPVVWTSLVGASANSNSLTKTAATAWGNAGAVSSLALASGNGSVEVTASETTSYRMFGLSNGDSSANYTDIDFGFYPAAGGGLWVYEAGTSRGSFGTYGTNDKLQVAVESGVVKYKKNGTVVYTSTLAPTYPLLVDTALYTQGATLNAAAVSGGWN